MFILRPSSLEEREEFYRNEFDINKLSSWFKYIPHFFVIDHGSETKIIRDKSKVKKLTVFKPNINLNRLKEKLVYYKPEDVYYDRNVYKDPSKCFKCFNFEKCFECDNIVGQQLAFDIDPENVGCDKHKKEYLSFCLYCLKKTFENSYDLSLVLKKEFNFKEIKLVYSGRGCHVHVFDDKALKLNIEERKEINNKVMKFGIDPWVSHGKVRLMRLPYSLNALVSRIVVPLNLNEIKSFNPLKNKKTIPKFLKEEIERFEFFKI